MPNVTPNLDQLFQIALQHHHAGRVAEAEQLYRQILSQQPNHADALHSLGVLAMQLGQADIAVNLIQQVIALQPNRAEAHNDLGMILSGLGKLDQAVAACRRAIALKPNYPAAYYNLANALSGQGQLDEAIAAYQRTIALQPDFPQAHHNLGNVLRGKGQLPEAIAAYRQAIALKLDHPEIHNNLGILLQQNKQLDEAILAFRRAIALRPNFPEAYLNLGAALLQLGQKEDAIAAFRAAIALRPNYPEAHINLGAALVKNGELDEAIAAFRQAIALDSNDGQAYCNLGTALTLRGELDEAISAFRKAIDTSPNVPMYRSNLIFTLNCDPRVNAAALNEEARSWNRQHAEPLRQFIQPHLNDRDPTRRLRIGYVSPDFRHHAVAYFLLALFAEHDHKQFEVVCYADVAHPDAVTAQLRSHADRWHNIVGMPDAQLADQIRREQIDILVDLAGHTADNRLLVFARKPAPIQVTYLGYPASTGVTAIDYRLADALADPPGSTEAFHSEQVFRLPRCAWCYRPPAHPTLEPRPQRPITFGCFNTLGKVTTATLSLWARILQAVPGSNLLLKNLAVTDPSAADRIRALMHSQGVDKARLELIGRTTSHDDHLRLYRRIDIALDTFPYHGTTTTCEALWMGVPVVCLAGQTHVSRVGVSLLTNVGTSELIAATPDQYIQIAAALADDCARLAEYHTTLRDRMQRSPLMDAPRFARDVEAAYRQMWKQWCVEDARRAGG